MAGNLAGSATWSRVRLFDAADATDGWKRFDPLRWNDIGSVDRSIAVWVELTGSGELRVAGKVPCTTSITLAAGWNLVGFPSMTATSVASATAGLSGGVTVEAYDPTGPYHLQRLAPSSVMSPGAGYWIHAPASQVWDIVNDPALGCEGTGP